MRIRGGDLQVGDTIRVWWRPGRDTITALTGYDGPLKGILGAGTRIAHFALITTGMTIPPETRYERTCGGQK